MSKLEDKELDEISGGANELERNGIADALGPVFSTPVAPPFGGGDQQDSPRDPANSAEGNQAIDD